MPPHGHPWRGAGTGIGEELASAPSDLASWGLVNRVTTPERFGFMWERPGYAEPQAGDGCVVKVRSVSPQVLGGLEWGCQTTRNPTGTAPRLSGAGGTASRSPREVADDGEGRVVQAPVRELAAHRIEGPAAKGVLSAGTVACFDLGGWCRVARSAPASTAGVSVEPPGPAPARGAFLELGAPAWCPGRFAILSAVLIAPGWEVGPWPLPS